MQGITSHIYLWPAYALIAFLLLFSFCLLFNLMQLFSLLLFLGLLFYSFIILFESARISNKYGDKKLFLYAILLFPLIHISYAYGIMIALMRKKIW